MEWVGREQLRKDASAPVYAQLAAALRGAIFSGRLSTGAAVGEERALADYLGLSRMTVRRAISAVVAEGLVTRVRGRGSFVAAGAAAAAVAVGAAPEEQRKGGVASARKPGAGSLESLAALAKAAGVNPQAAGLPPLAALAAQLKSGAARRPVGGLGEGPTPAGAAGILPPAGRFRRGMKIVIVAPFSQRDLMARQFYYRIFQGMQAAVGEWAQTPVQTAAEAGQRGLPIEITFRPTPAGPTGIASPADARQVGLLVQDLNADATVDAVALLGIADPALLAGLAALAKPVVLIDSAWPAGATPVDKVRLENAGGVRAAVEHLIQLGHRSIGLLNFVPDTQAARERREVYLATLAAAGLPAPAAGVVAVELTGTAAFGAMRPRLAAERQRAAAARITAWFCSSDELAAGLMAAAQDCGLNIPGDLSVVGFGDLGQFVWPPLSSVRIAMEEMGRRAVGLCVGRWLDRSVSAQEVVVPGELVVRGTSGVGGM